MKDYKYIIAGGATGFIVTVLGLNLGLSPITCILLSGAAGALVGVFLSVLEG